MSYSVILNYRILHIFFSYLIFHFSPNLTNAAAATPPPHPLLYQHPSPYTVSTPWSPCLYQHHVPLYCINTATPPTVSTPIPLYCINTASPCLYQHRVPLYCINTTSPPQLYQYRVPLYCINTVVPPYCINTAPPPSVLYHGPSCLAVGGFVGLPLIRKHSCLPICLFSLYAPIVHFSSLISPSPSRPY